VNERKVGVKIAQVGTDISLKVCGARNALAMLGSGGCRWRLCG
jgi:hypothetical protein